MTRSLMSGITTGLRTHQQQLDVVANNLANMNTVAYKSQSTRFSDLMYDNIRAGSTSEVSGGTNPQSIGTGVQLAQVTRNFQQGVLQSTGNVLDYAIQGDGFFVVQSAAGENLYTRAGAFTLDGNGKLVDPATGNLVQRIREVGDGTEDQFGFQTPGDSSIYIPMGAAIPGAETNVMNVFGNLPSSTLPPSSEVVLSTDSFRTDTGLADRNTLFSDLSINDVDYGPGDTILINGTNPDGSPFSGSLIAQGATLGDLVDGLNGLMTGAVAELLPNGQVSISADELGKGDAFLGLELSDAQGNVGSSTFARNTFFVESEGYDGDQFQLTTEIFDLRGESHTLNLNFIKTSANAWDIEASMKESSGTLLDNSILNLSFNEDGSYALAGADGVGDVNLTIDFESLNTPQTIALSFREVSHLASEFSLNQSQDGFPPGTLVSVAATSEGLLNGLASNGRSIPLAQLAMASFPNQNALDPFGSNYYQKSLNSGNASIGVGISGGRGQVISGQLESSNVDIANEFTQLIVAQRGFSANARTITVADEMLEELTNIIR